MVVVVLFSLGGAPMSIPRATEPQQPRRETDAQALQRFMKQHSMPALTDVQCASVAAFLRARWRMEIDEVLDRHRNYRTGWGVT